MSIKQPKDISVKTFNGTLNIKWSKNFAHTTNTQFQNAQRFVDSECIRLMKPYTPFRNGILEKSVTLGTVIGSGRLVYLHLGARYLYYGMVYGPNIPMLENGELIGFFSPKGQPKHPTGAELVYDTTKHPLAGKLWFERMKADHQEEIRIGAEKRAGGTK